MKKSTKLKKKVSRNLTNPDVVSENFKLSEKDSFTMQSNEYLDKYKYEMRSIPVLADSSAAKEEEEEIIRSENQIHRSSLKSMQHIKEKNSNFEKVNL